MDGRVGEPTFQEAHDSERDSDELLIGIQCHGCDYQLWTSVRPHVPTRIQCFREDCRSARIITLMSTPI
jgi:hypothetical protein